MGKQAACTLHRLIRSHLCQCRFNLTCSRLSRENPGRHRANIQTAHRKAPLSVHCDEWKEAKVVYIALSKAFISTFCWFGLSVIQIIVTQRFESRPSRRLTPLTGGEFQVYKLWSHMILLSILSCLPGFGRMSQKCEWLHNCLGRRLKATV